MSSAIRSIEVSRQPNMGVRLSGLKYIANLVAAETFKVSDSTRPEDLHEAAHTITAQHTEDIQPPMTPPERAVVTAHAVSTVIETQLALLSRLEADGIRAEKPAIDEEADV